MVKNFLGSNSTYTWKSHGQVSSFNTVHTVIYYLQTAKNCSSIVKIKHNHYIWLLTVSVTSKFNDASLLHAELNTKINIGLNIQGHALGVIKLY